MKKPINPADVQAPAEARERLQLVSPRSAHGTPRHRPLTARQEGFAVDVAAGVDAKTAFLKHYTWNGNPAGVSNEARQVAALPHVAARIGELRDRYAIATLEATRGPVPNDNTAAPYTVKSAMDELDDAMAVAKAKENPMAMAKVVEIRMKLYGLGVAEAKNPLDKDELSPEQLEQGLRDLRALRERSPY
jgi:hypothetical protein